MPRALWRWKGSSRVTNLYRFAVFIYFYLAGVCLAGDAAIHPAIFQENQTPPPPSKNIYKQLLARPDPPPPPGNFPQLIFFLKVRSLPFFQKNSSRKIKKLKPTKPAPHRPQQVRLSKKIQRWAIQHIRVKIVEVISVRGVGTMKMWKMRKQAK